MSNHDSRTIGIIGERLAADFLVKKGYTILNRNYHSRYGEIDLIARNSEYLVFVEVKARNENTPYRPSEAVSKSKRAKLWKTALLYLAENPQNLQPRMDIIEIVLTKGTQVPVYIEHIENAFFMEDGYAAY